MSGAVLVMYSNLSPTQGHRERLRAIAAGREVVVAGSEAEALEAAPGASVFLGHRYFRQCLPQAKGLRWAQSTAAGVEALVTAELLQRDVLVSRCPIFSHVVAQHAVAMAWSLMRRLPDAARRQPERQWSWELPFAPLPRRALVLGMGAIGLEVARLLRALGIQVTGVCRRHSAERERHCDELVTGDAWRQALPQTDILVMALPRTRDTLGLFDATALDALPAHAVVVDVGRAGTMDVGHALQRLRHGDLLGLGLDVADMGSFVEDSDWRTPGLLVTPKVSTFRQGRQADLEAYVEAQLQRFLAGEEPLNQVSREALSEMRA